MYGKSGIPFEVTVTVSSLHVALTSGAAKSGFADPFVTNLVVISSQVNMTDVPIDSSVFVLSVVISSLVSNTVPSELQAEPKTIINAM